MAHVAGGCAAADGRTVVAVATTAKAVAELDAAGLPACTIAAFRNDHRQRGLTAGTVVILDEVSQTSTRDAHSVLVAVAACPGAQLWILGDAQQAPAVKAGGIAAEIAARTASGVVPAAELTVNRRQLDPTDRHALDLLRHGDPHSSQHVRREHGWEHTGATPTATREAMADAVASDIVRDGAENTVALVVSHAQAEDLADRIRQRLAGTGLLGGRSITGPGWTTDRYYQAGDRLLLHCRHGDRRSPLINGTVGTIVGVEHQRMTFVPDRGQPVELPAAFVTGTRADGSPNVSHAWARTVDGAQGGTWDHAHLLGTAALDAYRGYTAQSRSRQPTHTWNTASVPTVDFGGRLAHQPDPDGQVAAALARIPDTTMAAIDDPWIIDRQLRDMIAAHQAELDRQPPDRQHALTAAQRALQTAQEKLAAAENGIATIRHQLDDLGPFNGLSRDGRARRRQLDHGLNEARTGAIESAGEVARTGGRVARLAAEQAAHDNHDHTHGWRHQAIEQAWDRLDQHWTDVAVACVRADQPLAHGIAPLRIAYRHLTTQLAEIQAAIPPDRSRDLDVARQDLDGAVQRRQEAGRDVAVSQAELDQHHSRRWPRRDRDAISRCTQRLDRARDHFADEVNAENVARSRFADLGQDQQDHVTAAEATAGQRQTLTASIRQIDRALDRTLTERVLRIVERPGALYLDILGPVPADPAGRAVWCQRAGELERCRDRIGANQGAWRQLVDDLADTPELVEIAKQHIPIRSLSVDPGTWHQVTIRANDIRESIVEHTRGQDPRNTGIGIEL
jgi:hypothetical protein